MPSLPQRVTKGPPRLKAKINEIIDYLVGITPQSSAEVWPDFGSGSGVSYRLAKKYTKKTAPYAYAPAAVVHFPFELYIDPDATGSAAWRTFKVWPGTVSNIVPDNINGQIVVPASSTAYKVWLDCAILTTDEDPHQGEVTEVAVAVGASGWSGYPAQPAGDNTTGAPPEHLYILIGEITTGVDAPDTDAAYHKLTPSPAQQFVVTSLAAAMYGYEIFCDGGVGFKMRKRITHTRA